MISNGTLGNLLTIDKPLSFFSVEVFDKDKLGKDKSLGKIEVNPRDLDNEAKWYPLQVLIYNFNSYILKNFKYDSF